MPGRNGPYLKPGWFVKNLVNPLLMKLGLVPVLVVRGRKTGKMRSVPVNVLEYQGQKYLVAPRGNTDWVLNLRSAGEGMIRFKGKTEHFRAVEVPDHDKPPIIQAYLQKWGAQVKKQFEVLPDPAHHPIFRMESSTTEMG